MTETDTTLDRITALKAVIDENIGPKRAELKCRIREARAEGFTLATIAEAAGVSVQYVSKVCKEER